MNPFSKGLSFQYLKPTDSWLGPPPADTTTESQRHGMLAILTAWCEYWKAGDVKYSPHDSTQECCYLEQDQKLTNEGNDNHKYPTKLDQTAHHLDFSEDCDSPNVDQNEYNQP